MLQINKILLKKIKFPLSLRSDRSNFGHSGFSLIELMVAVAILAMVSFGIFQAFSTGFMGMTDAKYRTIANNIAQKILEEVKSKNLAVGYSATLEPETISDKEFTATIDIEEGPDDTVPTLNKAIATVKWKDRNNSDKEITLETLVNTFSQKPETDVPTYILLSIDPTSLILNEDTANITVTILDQDRYPINFDGQINLSVVPDLGNFIPTTLFFSSQTNQTTTFTPEETGEAQIEARDNANNLYPDAKTIKITRKPAKIKLTADPVVILKDTGQSIVTIEILDSENNLVEFTGTITITTVPEDISATLSLETIEFENEDTKTFTLSAGEEAEEITIKANAQYEGEDLLEGSTTVRVSGGPDHLLLSSDRESIQNNGTDSAVLTITVVDVDDYPIAYNSSDQVMLSISSSDPSGMDGVFDPATLTFTGETALNSNFSTSSSAGKIFIIANNIELGNSNIVEISITTGPPDYLEVVADPHTIIADGQTTSTITVTAKDENGYTTALGSIGSPVQVNISLNPEIGQIGEDNPEDYTISFSGQVSQTVTFTSTTAGTVTVTASSAGLDSGSDEITITAGVPTKIHLSATPLSITNDGEDESIITISILDENDNEASYTGNIELSLNPVYGGEIGSPATQISEGLYGISFTSETSKNCPFTSIYEDNIDVEISASDPEGELEPSNSVIIEVGSTSINVSEIEFYNYTIHFPWGEYEVIQEDKIRFNFEVTGNLIQLSEMDINWVQNPPTYQTRELQGFTIWENSEIWNNIIYDRDWYWGISSSQATGIEIGETLYPSPTVTTYIGEMDFDGDMDTNHWTYTIIFRDNSDPKKEYPINFTFPE